MFNSKGIRPYLFGEYIFYPPFSKETQNMKFSNLLKKYSRGGIGYGFVVPLTAISEHFNLHIYQNVLVFNADNRGDVARTGYFEFEIGLF